MSRTEMVGFQIPLAAVVANVMVHALPRFRSLASFSALFSDELQTILTLVEGVSVDSAARPVLIDRIRGIEDSSRHWSVYMTLDHLRIVNLGMVGVIVLLGLSWSVFWPVLLIIIGTTALLGATAGAR